eukprot:CAMPEP_0119467416 /NCGR_PEP_ID=MMETSP1344-20130328/1614_1 /TAXON_ID=236787 /ORGANISM="Florenciella parvula, Strain CCMP2471" /LENGTH=132 /DNA_ID=CAMNT_0007499781 /DNA_START=17 /DNA_END=411 /DNA_ORIENTATION=-
MMQAKVKQIEKLDVEAKADDEEQAALSEDQELPLKLLDGGEINGNLISLRDVGFRYPPTTPDGPEGPLLFEHAEFAVDSKSRIVLLGENGNGKTTLAKLMLGHLTPTIGEVMINPHGRTAIVNQHHADQIDL